jgi:hypothetical protein
MTGTVPAAVAVRRPTADMSACCFTFLAAAFFFVLPPSPAMAHHLTRRPSSHYYFGDMSHQAAPSLPALSATLRTAGAASRSRTVRVACSAATQGSGKPTSNVVVLGASGYTGSEIVRLLHLHPHLKITGMTAESNAGRPFDEVYPQLGGLDLPLLVKTEVRPYASPLIDAARACSARETARACVMSVAISSGRCDAKRTACAQRKGDGGDTRHAQWLGYMEPICAERSSMLVVAMRSASSIIRRASGRTHAGSMPLLR